MLFWSIIWYIMTFRSEDMKSDCRTVNNYLEIMYKELTIPTFEEPFWCSIE